MIIAISGMIGSGKTTLTKKLHKHFKRSVFLEEFSDNDPVFNTYLKWIYEKKPNIDISFQSFIVESLTDSFNKEKKKFLANKAKYDFLFLDRFILEHYIFAVITLEKKPKKYLEAFAALFDYIYDKNTSPEYAIYIDIDWNTFKERIFSRGREVEVENFHENEAYFKRLHDQYLPIFLKLVKKYDIPYCIINSTGKTEEQVFKEAKQKIIELQKK